jgi:hypothetical protein
MVRIGRHRHLVVVFPVLSAIFSVFTWNQSAAGIFTDSANRKIEIPDAILRVMAAGPPAATFTRWRLRK